MSPIRKRGVYEADPAHKEVPPPAASAPLSTGAPADPTAKAESPKVEQDRVTFYAPVDTVEHLDDLLYLASKQGKQMKIRDRTHIVRALVMALQQSGHGLGRCCTEEELREALTRKLSR